MPLHVCFEKSPPPEIIQHFYRQLDNRIIPHWDISTNRADNCQVLVSGRPFAAFLHQHPELSHLLIPFAGVPEATRTLMEKFPSIAVHNIHHNAAATAEMAVTLLLAAAKFVLPLDKQLRRNDWSARYEAPATLLLADKTILILGYGAIGKRVAQVCRAFGMHVFATRSSSDNPYPDSNDVVVHPASKLRLLLPQANILMITLPLTEDTIGLIGEHELGLLPANSVLVNVGRGPIVDEQALFLALSQGRLAAAGLDVWWQYPETADDRNSTPPSNFPFQQLENVVMSPHRGGATQESDKLRYACIADSLNSLIQTGKMPNKVDLQRGY